MTTEQGGQSEPVTAEAIVIRAYEIYLACGREDGHDVEDWQQAEAELTGGRGWEPEPSEAAGQPDERSPQG